MSLEGRDPYDFSVGPKIERDENDQMAGEEREDLKGQLGEAKFVQEKLLQRIKLLEEHPNVVGCFLGVAKEIGEVHEKLLRKGDLHEGKGQYSQGALSVIDQLDEVLESTDPPDDEDDWSQQQLPEPEPTVIEADVVETATGQ